MAARASRRWRWAAAAALAAHAVLFVLVVRSVKIDSPLPEPRAFGVELVRLEPLPARRSAPPRPARPAASPSPALPSPAQPVPAMTSQAAPAAVPAAPSSSDGDAAGRVRAMLRGSVGCDSAGGRRLGEEERSKCAAWRAAHVDPKLQIPAPIDPVKKDWFDASLRARQLGQAPPFGRRPPFVHTPPRLIVGQCGGDGGAVKDSVKAGPCNAGIPGMFNDDDAPPP